MTRTQVGSGKKGVSVALVSALTYAMFFMFAMTTDAVGEIIKIARVDMNLSNTEASAFHWATMIAIAMSGIGLGFLADRFGRKKTIIGGLAMYGVASALFMTGQSFQLYFTLLFISGLAIGVFKTSALALVGDLANSTDDHTSRMNAVEGFFGVGAIIGPLLVVWLTGQGLSWTWLYMIAACLCALMIIAALVTEYPLPVRRRRQRRYDTRCHFWVMRTRLVFPWPSPSMSPAKSLSLFGCQPFSKGSPEPTPP